MTRSMFDEALDRRAQAPSLEIDLPEGKVIVMSDARVPPTEMRVRCGNSAVVVVGLDPGDYQQVEEKLFGRLGG